MTIGFLHPGSMGASLAALCQDRTIWASDGRSRATADRAKAAGVEDVGSITRMAEEADVIVSICPPASAEAVAVTVAVAGFRGIYVDANAIAPATARRIGGRFDRFVDGGVIGPPAGEPGTTRLHVSGADDDVAAVASLWEGTALEVRRVPGDPGAASAVKVGYAAWTKGTAALLLAIHALAEAEGVTEALTAEWATSQPDLVGRGDARARAVAPKAWRWVGEMEQIAATFEDAELPGGFHRAAADVYERLTRYRDADRPPPLAEVVDTLLDGPA